MPAVNKHTHGSFCWSELMTIDSAGAKDFYAELYDWDFRDDPVGPDSFYTMLEYRGLYVGALCQQNPELKALGMPPTWLNYISVDGLDEKTEKAKQLGGKVLMGPVNVMDVGRTSIMVDPTGATFALWEPRKHLGRQWIDETGAVCWTELLTSDADVAGKFYADLLGWKLNTQSQGPVPYTTFRTGDIMAGGMMAMQDEWSEALPHWLVYFGVNDVDKTAEKVLSLGGEVIAHPMNVEEVGRVATFKDPQGALFAVVKFSPPRP